MTATETNLTCCRFDFINCVQAFHAFSHLQFISFLIYVLRFTCLIILKQVVVFMEMFESPSLEDAILNMASCVDDLICLLIHLSQNELIENVINFRLQIAT